MRTSIALAVLSTLAALLPACRASVNVNAKATAEEREEELSSAASSPAKETVSTAPTGRTEYFGIARGLSLNPGTQPVCSCVAAAVGYPGNDEFKWRGVPPKVADDALVVAIGTEGVACDKQGPGPSILAVDRAGDDVIVVLEEWHQARPQALGAIIPNPGANGHVYLRSHRGSPYGNPLSSGAGPRGAWCRIGQGSGAPNQVVSPASNLDLSDKSH